MASETRKEKSFPWKQLIPNFSTLLKWLFSDESSPCLPNKAVNQSNVFVLPLPWAVTSLPVSHDIGGLLYWDVRKHASQTLVLPPYRPWFWHSLWPKPNVWVVHQVPRGACPQVPWDHHWEDGGIRRSLELPLPFFGGSPSLPRHSLLWISGPSNLFPACINRWTLHSGSPQTATAYFHPKTAMLLPEDLTPSSLVASQPLQTSEPWCFSWSSFIFHFILANVVQNTWVTTLQIISPWWYL